MKPHTLFLLLSSALLACQGGSDTPERTPGGAAGTGGDVPRTTDTRTSERGSWQQPDVVLDIMGDLTGRTVALLFADDGYWVAPLVDRGAKVIALDPDAADRQALEALRDQVGAGMLEVRATDGNTTGLGMREADMALCVNNYMAPADRIGFYQQVRLGLKEPRQIFFVDMKGPERPAGVSTYPIPDINTIMDELGAAGCTDVASRSNLLPYQFVMVGQDVHEVPYP